MVGKTRERKDGAGYITRTTQPSTGNGLWKHLSLKLGEVRGKKRYDWGTGTIRVRMAEGHWVDEMLRYSEMPCRPASRRLTRQIKIIDKTRTRRWNMTCTRVLPGLWHETSERIEIHQHSQHQCQTALLNLNHGCCPLTDGASHLDLFRLYKLPSRD